MRAPAGETRGFTAIMEPVTTFVRPDVRLDDGPMMSVACSVCRAEVKVRKSSLEQTSIQWNAQSLGTCSERALVQEGQRFPGCTRLKESIRDAVDRGELTVLSYEPTPVNEQAHR